MKVEVKEDETTQQHQVNHNRCLKVNNRQHSFSFIEFKHNDTGSNNCHFYIKHVHLKYLCILM